jgi:hypothetical protein
MRPPTREEPLLIECVPWLLGRLPIEELREEEPKMDPREGREEEEPRDDEPLAGVIEEPRDDEPLDELEEEEPLEGVIEEPREPLWAWA